MIICAFAWILVMMAIISVGMRYDPDLASRFHIGLMVVAILTMIWVFSNISVNEPVFPDGYPYPWSIIGMVFRI